VSDPGVVARVHAMSLYLHERCRDLIGNPGPDPGSVLSPREIECLRWVSLGKSDWEIGRILGISHNTAHFHVEQAKRKLGVRTRSQAAAVLVLGGLT
jgi:DNA-binding CsgD family transcriptional regulator